MLPNEIISLANRKGVELGIPHGNLPAIIHVESNGKVFEYFDEEPFVRPVILFEPHLFGRKLTGPAKDEAIRIGLATTSQKKNKYPKSQKARWDQIAAAAELCIRYGLNPDYAGESASYGVGQVLGSHWKSLGYASFDDFYDANMSGAEGQIDVMLRYIQINGLLDELQEGRWSGFFRGYNGPDWQRLGYGTKIEKALALYGGSISAKDGMLRIGSKGARVRELQALLVRAGYQVKVDGDFGPATKAAVRAFQTAHGLKVDGVVGPRTEDALQAYRQGSDDRPGKEAVAEIDGVKKGAGGLLTAGGIEIAQQKVDEATATLQTVDGFQPWLGYGLTALSLIAAGLALWALYVGVKGWLASNRTVEA